MMQIWQLILLIATIFVCCIPKLIIGFKDIDIMMQLQQVTILMCHSSKKLARLILSDFNSGLHKITHKRLCGDSNHTYIKSLGLADGFF